MWNIIVFTALMCLPLGIVAGVVFIKKRGTLLLLREKGYRVYAVSDMETMENTLRLKSNSDIFPVRTVRLEFARIVVMSDHTVLALMSSGLPSEFQEAEIQVCRQPQHTAYFFLKNLDDKRKEEEKRKGKTNIEIIWPEDTLDYAPQEYLIKRPKIHRRFRSKKRPNPHETDFWIVVCSVISPSVRLFCAPGAQKRLLEESDEDPKLNKLLDSMGLKPR